MRGHTFLVDPQKILNFIRSQYLTAGLPVGQTGVRERTWGLPRIPFCITLCPPAWYFSGHDFMGCEFSKGRSIIKSPGKVAKWPGNVPEAQPHMGSGAFEVPAALTRGLSPRSTRRGGKGGKSW